MRLISQRWARVVCVLLVLLVCVVQSFAAVADERLASSSVAVVVDVDDTVAVQHTVWDSDVQHHSPLPAASSPRAADAVDAQSAPSSAPASLAEWSLHASDKPQMKRKGLSATEVDTQLLHELDRLIHLHQQKVDVLLRMRHDIQHTAHTPHQSNYAAPTVSAVDQTTPSAHSPIGSPAAARQPRANRPHPSSSEPFTLSSALPQLVQRASLFLAAIAVLLVYQYVQHKRAQRPATNTSHEWNDEWMTRRRRREATQQPPFKAYEVAGVRRRRTVGAVGDEEERCEEEGKELRVESEVYEERGGGEWDEAEGDYWDASDSRHDGYVGVFGVEDDEKEGLEEDEHATTNGGGLIVDDVDDEEEYEEEEDDELADDDEQG